MSEWFQTKVKFLRQMDNGLVKEITEQYLVDAMSFTETEARAMQEVGEGTRSVTMMTIARSPIKEVVFYGDTDLWFKTRVTYSLMDEVTEKEKKVTTHFLVNANDVKEAYERTEEHLKEMLVPFQIPKIEESPIIDVFQRGQSMRPKHVDDVASDLRKESKADSLIEEKIGFKLPKKVTDPTADQAFDPSTDEEIDANLAYKNRRYTVWKMIADAGFTALESDQDEIEGMAKACESKEEFCSLIRDFDIDAHNGGLIWDFLQES